MRECVKDEGFELTAGAVFAIIWDFFKLSVVSIAIGIAFGVLSAVFTKYLRHISHSAVSESSLLILIAMISYFISETIHMSGIVTLLTCSIVMTHYTWYNLSP